MEKVYQRIDFHNGAVPALNETNLNAMSKAIDDLDDRVVLIAGDVLVTVPQLQEMMEHADQIMDALEQMSQNPPYIGANGNWYVFNTTTLEYEDSGIDASITVQIADVTAIEPDAQPYVTNTGTDTDPVFHLFIPRGQTGATGNGISGIAKTGTSGLVDTYTISMTDGTTYTFTVTNGQDGHGSGDMTKAAYDSDNSVANAGGIAPYVQGVMPAAQVNSDWNANSGVAQILNKPVLGSASAKNSTSAVTSGGTDLPEAGAVYSAIDGAVDKWTATAQVDSNGVVTFSGLSDTYGYDLYAEDVLVSISAITKTGSGSSVTLAYQTDASAGTVCKLRILK